MLQLFGIGIFAIILYFAQRQVYIKLWERGLKIDLFFEPEGIFEGEKGVIKELVENHKFLPLSMLKVKFQTSRNLVFDNQKGSRVTDQYYRNDVFQIGGGERITRTLPFVGQKRGYYSITGVDLVASDLFMTNEMTDRLELYRTIYVYPKPYNSREFHLSLQKLNGEVLTRRHLLEDPFEYRGIREYEPFDDMRSINWKATAKTGELKVNQKNYTQLESIRVFLNVDDIKISRKTESAETGIRVMVGLSEYFLHQGIRVACYTNGADIVTGSPFVTQANSGRGQIDDIYRGLARIDLEREAQDFLSLFEETLLNDGINMFTCVIFPDQNQEFIKLLEKMQDKGIDFIWFYPTAGKKEPVLPPSLEEKIRVLHF